MLHMLYEPLLSSNPRSFRLAAMLRRLKARGLSSGSPLLFEREGVAPAPGVARWRHSHPIPHGLLASRPSASPIQFVGDSDEDVRRSLFGRWQKAMAQMVELNRRCVGTCTRRSALPGKHPPAQSGPPKNVDAKSALSEGRSP